MVSCQDCEKYLDAFLDDALDVKETLDIAEHLQSCTVCSDRVEAERTLRGFIRQHAAVPALPDDVKRRIIRQAMHPAGSRPRWLRSGMALRLRDFALGVAVAAALLLLFFGPLSNLSIDNDMASRFIREASITYQTYKTDRMPPEVASADDTIVAKWFNSRMGYPMKIPCITDEATKLLGGRLCRLLDRKTAMMIYQRYGKDIILFAFKGNHLSLPEKYRVRTKDREFYVRRIAGRPVAIWRRGGTVYSMVSDLPQDDLLQVAATIAYR